MTAPRTSRFSSIDSKRSNLSSSTRNTTNSADWNEPLCSSGRYMNQRITSESRKRFTCNAAISRCFKLRVGAQYFRKFFHTLSTADLTPHSFGLRIPNRSENWAALRRAGGRCAPRSPVGGARGFFRRKSRIGAILLRRRFFPCLRAVSREEKVNMHRLASHSFAVGTPDR